MAESIVTQLSSLINHQVDSHQNLAIYLSKVDALVQVAMKSQDVLGILSHDYLWVLSDIVGQARDLNENSLSFLLKIPSSLMVH